MRITITLDEDTVQLVRSRMRERGLSFEEAVNELIRRGATEQVAPFATATASMGEPQVDLDRALQLGAIVEDDALIRRMRSGS